jgi:hypothetical protein
MTLRFRCTVRGCAATLERDGDRMVCPNAHAFDRAREGYWNLLQPQDRKSSAAGDHDDATRARRRWLARGFASGLIQAMHPFVAALAPAAPPLTSVAARARDLAAFEDRGETSWHRPSPGRGPPRGSGRNSRGSSPTPIAAFRSPTRADLVRSRPPSRRRARASCAPARP